MTGAIIDPIQCGYENLQLLGEYEFGGDTSYTFSHLHGYTDEKFLLTGTFKTVSATALNQIMYLRFNGDTAAHYYERRFMHSTRDGLDTRLDNSATYIYIGSLLDTYTSAEHNLRLLIHAKEGYAKKVIGWCESTNGTRSVLIFPHGSWNQSSEITSITVGCVTAGVTLDEGNLTLYRVIEK